MSLHTLLLKRSRKLGKFMKISVCELLLCFCFVLDYMTRIDIGHVDFLETVHKQAKKPYVIVGLHFDQVCFIKQNALRDFTDLSSLMVLVERAKFAITNFEQTKNLTWTRKGEVQSHNLSMTTCKPVLQSFWTSLPQGKHVFKFPKMLNTIRITDMVTTVKMWYIVLLLQDLSDKIRIVNRFKWPNFRPLVSDTVNLWLAGL